MKLTKNVLKRIIEEEMSKFGPEVSTEDAADETEEVDADEYADTLAKKIDYVKALKIEESRLVRRLKKIRETKKKIGSQVIKSL